ncbi:MAG TPA: glycine/sarcosine/betaine reductase complex component C subunit beta [Candidatus Binatia bacterium]
MSNFVPVIKAASSVLIHTPGLTRYGSKPHREISANPARLADLNRNLRSFQQAQAYLPNQVFIGQQAPEKLSSVSRPWFDQFAALSEERKSFGSIVDEKLFLALIALADPFKHVALLDHFWEETVEPLRQLPICRSLVSATPNVVDSTKLKTVIAQDGGLPLFAGSDFEPVGFIADGHHEDESLSATVLLENLCGKVSAALSLQEIFGGNPSLKKQDVDFVLGCSEEAVGDRYQRGGGNLAKAIAEFSGCDMASGFDIKDFCAAPIPAMVTAAALVQSGVAENIVVVGGSSLPKLGMKFLYHLEKKIPVLEDMQAAVAVWVGRDDGKSPIINLAGVGRHPVSAGASLDQQLKSLVVDPLNRLELGVPAIDKFVTELHNPEITLPANGGDVAERNYRMLGAVLVKAGKLAKSDLALFMKEKGLPGYAPTQGHIASALAYVPHAVQELTHGQFKRCFLFARASLFLGQMTQLSDGMSVMLERQ